jgi:HPt (histidine-containing phosphotransfer) domain-containing protein
MSQIPLQPNDESGSINWSAALDAVDNDEELLEEVVTVFLDEAPETMAKLLRSIEQADPSVLRLSAHTVLGSLRIFECPTASEYARQIEQIGKIRKQEQGDLTNEELTQAKKLWGRLNEQFSVILPAMEERIKKK